MSASVLRFLGATVEYSPHAGLDTNLMSNIMDASYSALFKVYQHVDGSVLYSEQGVALISEFMDL